MTYVLSEESRRQYQAELARLQTQRAQLQQTIRNLTYVAGSSAFVFVYSLNGSNRWECWPTNTVSARLNGIAGTQANYRAWWKYLLQQHKRYRQYVLNSQLPALRAQVAQIELRMRQIEGCLKETKEEDPGLTDVSVKESPVRMSVWDHGSEDGDIVRIFIDGQFYRQITLTKKRIELTVPLPYGKHRFEVQAVNEGKSKPNTASLDIHGQVKGKYNQKWRLKTGQTAGMWITVGR